MINAYLEKLYIKDFGPFVGEHEINFHAKGLTLIEGINKDTGGRSAAGKSFTLKAINYALDIADSPAKTFQSLLTNNTPLVILTVRVNNDIIEIERGARLKLRVNGTTIEGNAAIVKQTMDRYLGADKDIRRVLTFRAQRTFGTFLTFSDSEKKEFLTNLLNIGWIEKELENLLVSIKNKAHGVEQRSTMLSGQQVRLEEALSQIKEYPLYNVTNIKNRLERVKNYVKFYENGIFALEQDINKLRAVVVDEQRAVSIPKPDRNPQILEFQEKISVVKDEIDGIQQQLNLLTVQHSNSSSKIKELPKLRAELADIERQITQLNDAKCPTCSQSWIENDKYLLVLHDREGEIENKIEERVCHIELLNKLNEEIKDLSEKLKSKQNLKKSLEENRQVLYLQLFNSWQSDYQTATNAIEEKYKPEETSIRNKIAYLRTRINKGSRLISKISAVLGQKEAINKINAKLKSESESRVKQESQRLETFQKEFIQLERSYNDEREIYAFLDTFYNKYFQDILIEISNETNKILRNIPNVSTTTINLSTQKTTQEGKIKQAITLETFYSGDRVEAKHTVSGGMMSAIELAVDLALSTIVKNRMNINLNWVLLDESFNGLDAISVANLLEMLKEYAKDKLIVVIDHLSETQELFNQVFVVERQNGYSTIKTKEGI